MNDLVHSISSFCRLLRHSGLPVGPSESIDAVRVLESVDLTYRDQVYLGLRMVLVKRMQDFDLFDTAFRTFFDGETPDRGAAEQRRDAPDSNDDEAEQESGREGGYSQSEVLLQQDLAMISAGDQAEAARAAQRIARRLALRLSRRWRRSPTGHRINLKETVRRSGRYAGLPVELLRAKRKTRPATLILLLDVSGSMEMYSRVLLQFVHALQSRLPRTHSFCFATRLAVVSDELRAAAYGAAVMQAREKTEGWGGGTRIGTCLTQFCQEWARTLITRRSAVIILSDGLDTGDPELVGQAMATIGRRAGRVIWLNPLAGDDRYQPLARGMAAAMPHIDLFAPGHSLASLTALERELARLG